MATCSQTIDFNFNFHIDTKIMENLPNDVKNYILTFIPIDVRVNYVMTKYKFRVINEKLTNLEKNSAMCDYLYNCVKKVTQIMATQIQSYNPAVIIINDMLVTFNDYNSKKDLEYREKMVEYYINLFIDMILESIRNYIKIFRHIDSDKKKRFDNAILNLFIGILIL
jgi:hypothetical protein